MALDGIMLNKVVEDLNKYVPMRINKIYGINKTEVLFHVKSNRESKVLLISSEASSNRIHFTSRDYIHESHPNNFVMLLRKHLLNGQIVDIQQKDYDRFVKIVISNHNSIGDQVYFHIYLELLGRFANMVFCDENDVIFDAVKRISPLDNPKSAIIPGATYQIQTPQNKENPFEKFTFDVNQSLVNQFSGFSPTLDKEFNFRLKSGEEFKDIIEKINKSNNLFITTNANKTDFHTIPLLHISDNYKSYSLHEGFDKLYYEIALKKRIANETRNLAKFINRELKKQKKKIIRLEDQFEKNQNADINLKYGDLIITYQSKIKKGMKFANLIDYEDDQPITIQLDEKLDAIQNAQNYYKKYRKQSNSLIHLLEQIELANKEIDYFQLLSDQLEFADINSAKEIKQELIDNNYIFEKRKGNKPKRKAAPKFLSINYDENTVIRVGKSNIQNDYVTFKASNRNDFWFHVQDYHGAHVTVSTDELSDELINIAASFAAYFSKARSSKNIPVNYTQIRNVKKIPKAPLGMVAIENYQTVFIEVDRVVIDKYLD